MSADPDLDVPLWRVRARTPTGRVRATTINIGRLSGATLAAGAAAYPEDLPLPRTRGECAHATRPCPHARCGYHLALDVNAGNGSIRVNRPDRATAVEIGETCALDVADRGGAHLEEVGALLGVTRERIRQIETKALRRLRAACESRGLRLADLLPRPRSADPGLPDDSDGALTRTDVAVAGARMGVPEDVYVILWRAARAGANGVPGVPLPAAVQAIVCAQLRRTPPRGTASRTWIARIARLLAAHRRAP